MLVDEIKRKFLPAETFNHLNIYLRIHFKHLDEHILCWLEIKKADEAVFVTVQDEEFFSSGDAETRKITDKALVDYGKKRFRYKEISGHSSPADAAALKGWFGTGICCSYVPAFFPA